MLLESIERKNGAITDAEDIPDVLALGCPTRKTLALLSSIWTVLVLHVLADGTHRYSEIKSRVEGVTHKMLAQTLRALERDGLLVRKAYPVVPPRVEYTLSDLGHSLVPLLDSLCRWSEDHYREIESHRSGFGEVGAL
mgnify:CR=1 FL=1